MPEVVQTYPRGACSINTTSLFLDYVVRADMETEWKEIINTAFPVNAETGITAETQRLYVSKLRGAYRIARDIDGAAG